MLNEQHRHCEEPHRGDEAIPSANPTSGLLCNDTHQPERTLLRMLAAVHFPVMPGLDSGIHLLAKGMDCRVKSGNDT
jgi:hypothetical protein